MSRGDAVPPRYKFGSIETKFDTPLAFARKGGPGRRGQGQRFPSAKRIRLRTFICTSAEKTDLILSACGAKLCEALYIPQQEQNRNFRRGGYQPPAGADTHPCDPNDKEFYL